MLNKKDAQLIYELDLNARLSVNQLAKKIGMSQEATRYRIHRLQDRKVILGFVPYLHFVKLGYFGYCVYCRYAHITEQKKEEIKQYLKHHDHIYWIAEYGGRFDLSFSILAQSPLEFDGILQLILNKYSHYLTDVTLITKLEPHKYPRRYLIGKKQVYKQEKIGGSYVLKPLEQHVLKKLTTNARLTAAEIAHDLKRPLSTVIYTIKKLIREKIIGGFTVLLDPTAIGFQAYQLNIVTQNITDEKLKKLFTYCYDHPHIVLAIKVLGDWNIELVYEVENAKKMQACLIDLRNMFSDIIKDAELINFFEDYIKLNHYPFTI